MATYDNPMNRSEHYESIMSGNTRKKTYFGYTLNKLLERCDKRDCYIAEHIDYLERKRKKLRPKKSS